MSTQRAFSSTLLAACLTGFLAASIRSTASTKTDLSPIWSQDDLQTALANTTHYGIEYLHIEATKKYILNKLGMTEAPDISHVNTSVQERRKILRLYKKSMDDLNGKLNSVTEQDNYEMYANQFHSFAENGGKPSGVEDVVWTSTQKLRLFFASNIAEPSDPLKETIVKSATLKLYKNHVRLDKLVGSESVDRSVRIDVYQIIDLVSGNQSVRKSVDSRLVSLERLGWTEFNVASAVQDWIREPASNMGLEIVCADSRYRLQDVVEFVRWNERVDDDDGFTPTLNVLAQERAIIRHRKKRSAVAGSVREDCTQGEGENRCCRYPLTIVFRNISWDWVIEPSEYQSYYCDGTCPNGYKVAHRFASIKSIIMGLNPSSPLSLSCTATQLTPLSIAHYNAEGKLVVSVMEHMIASQCMCG